MITRRTLVAGALATAVAAQNAPLVAFITGDDEYRSEHSMPMIGRILETHHGLRTAVAFAKPTPQTVTHIEGLETLERADLAVFFLRWRQLPPEQIKRILAYVESGKPMVGLRTTTHSFKYPAGSPYEKWNDGFGRDLFGQKWFRHHGHRSSTDVRALPGQAGHPILRGVAPEFHVRSWLYEVTPLAGENVPLLEGRAVNPEGRDVSPQPVAWTRRHQNSRVFFTTLGHSHDFTLEPVRRLLVNGILWSLNRDVPAGGARVDVPGGYTPEPSGITPEERAKP